MARYLLRRLLLALPALLLLVTVAFALLELSPADPAVKAATRGTLLPRPEAVERYRQEFRLDEPVYVRYGYWLRGLATGDLGISWDTREPITHVLRTTLPRTLLLVGLGLLIAWMLALSLGTLAGIAPRSLFAHALNTLIAILVGTPTFVVALLALFVFAVHWRVFPTGGMVDAGSPTTIGQVARHVALPALVMGISYFGWYARVVAASVTDVSQRTYVTTARAKGLSALAVNGRHILRPALVPFMAQVGTSLSVLVGGSYAVEVVFSWPGLGREALRAARQEDYPVVMALVLVTGLVVIVGNLLADVIVALIDPRVRLERPHGG